MSVDVPVGPLERIILVTLIRWQARIERRQSVGLELSKGLGDEVRVAFPHATRMLSATDLEDAIVGVLRTAPDYRSWWRAIGPVSELTFGFADGEPIVPLDSVEVWEELQDHLDGDALITAQLADQARPYTDAETLVRQLDRWGVTLRAGDRSLETLWSRGLSDLHVHAGGVRFAQLAWFDLVDGAADPESFRTMEREERSRYAVAGSAREAVWKALGPEKRPPEDAPLPDVEDRWWRWDSRRLIGERVMLALFWLHDAPGEKLIRAMDEYLAIKSLFLSRARQPADTSPGLRVFEHHYRYTDRDPGFNATEISPRLAMRNYADALAYLGECADLRRLELRSPPASAAVEYGRLAMHFGMLVEAFNKSRRGHPVDARLAIHFKRSRTKNPANPTSLSKIIRTLDRESAALRAAQADGAYAVHVRQWFSRIDVAGWERDTPAAYFAPYLRLARGDAAALADLEQLQDDDPRAADFEHWRELRRIGIHRPNYSDARLGLTVHAGEDFADPLDGLNQVASAIYAFDMQAGDGIGHGLALTIDPVWFARERSDLARIRRGSHLESMVWLYWLIDREEGERPFSGLMGKLRSEIEDEARELYGANARLEDISWVLDNRRRPRSVVDWRRHGDDRKRLWERDASDEVRARQDQLVALPRVRRELGEVIPWAQERLMEEVIRRRVVVEMNPASNWRISGAGALSMSPTVKMLEWIDRGLLASVNTDNPGTFLSRVDNEYALLLAGCLAARMPAGKARDLLERARRIGMEETAWPYRPPADKRPKADDVSIDEQLF